MCLSRCVSVFYVNFLKSNDNFLEAIANVYVDDDDDLGVKLRKVTVKNQNSDLQAALEV